mmetsp:Transcript_38816/g.70487  ORF Transcript_38816/g.70487 Transcript_38816/m.70487 type:complete len:213 (+) Transcript_38816:285-923(+)
MRTLRTLKLRRRRLRLRLWRLWTMARRTTMRRRRKTSRCNTLQVRQTPFPHLASRCSAAPWAARPKARPRATQRTCLRWPKPLGWLLLRHLQMPRGKLLLLPPPHKTRRRMRKRQKKRRWCKMRKKQKYQRGCKSRRMWTSRLMTSRSPTEPPSPKIPQPHVRRPPRWLPLWESRTRSWQPSPGVEAFRQRSHRAPGQWPRTSALCKYPGIT